VFITCCEDERLETMEEGRVFHIHGGHIVGKEA
jgi:DNA replication and repair protein RecF